MTTADPTPASSSSACDILIVEDDALQAEELASFLSRSGWAVEVFHDGSTGLHRVATVKPPIVVVDYNMPGLDGAQVAERIRAVSPSTAVIMISGRISRPSDATLGRLGILAFLNKPFSLSSISSLIAELVRTARRTGQMPVAPLRGIDAEFG